MNWQSDVKKWFHSMTVWFAGGQVFIGMALLMLEEKFDLVSPYLGEWSGAVLMGLGIVNLWLRLRTAKAIAGTKAAKLP